MEHTATKMLSSAGVWATSLFFACCKASQHNLLSVVLLMVLAPLCVKLQTGRHVCVPRHTHRRTAHAYEAPYAVFFMMFALLVGFLRACDLSDCASSFSCVNLELTTGPFFPCR